MASVLTGTGSGATSTATLAELLANAKKVADATKVASNLSSLANNTINAVPIASPTAKVIGATTAASNLSSLANNLPIPSVTPANKLLGATTAASNLASLAGNTINSATGYKGTASSPTTLTDPNILRSISATQPSTGTTGGGDTNYNTSVAPVVQPVSTAPTASTLAEIKRKALAGIPLTNPTPEAMAIYNSAKAGIGTPTGDTGGTGVDAGGGIGDTGGGTTVADTLTSQNNDLLARLNDITSKQEAARQALSAQVMKITSPENYQRILDQVMKTMMPQFEAQKTEIIDQFTENSRLLNIDQERRGTFSAGFSADQQRQNSVDQTRSIASALAALQANAATEARATTAQQLQALGMQGDWLTSDANLAMQGLGLNQDINSSQADTTLTERGQNMDYTLANAKLAQDAGQFDTTMKFNQAELDQKAQEFTQELAFRKEVQATDVQQFAQKMKVDWAQVGVSQASQLADANYKSNMIDLNERQFASEKEASDYQMSVERLGTEADAYATLSSMSERGKELGFDESEIREDMVLFAEAYKTEMPELYSRLKKTIDNTYKASGTTSYTSTKVAPQVPYGKNPASD